MDIQGTILTEGMGVGRGTRFATPESNRRLDTGGRERGIEGGKGGINPGAAINIDPGLAHVRARPLDPLQTKPIITDGSGVSAKAISNVGDILSRAAFDYADRQAENEAMAATLAFNERARVAFYGNPDDPESKGLTGLQGYAAVSARESYFGAIDKDYAETVASLSPAAKQKALARMSGIRDTALNRGASHIAQEQHNYETQLRGMAVEDVTRDLPLDYHNAANLKTEMLSYFGQDAINGNKAWDSVAIEGGHRLYLEAYKRSDQNNPTGMASLLSYREQVAPTMSTKALNDLDTLIRSFQTHEIQAQKAAKIDEKNARREALEGSVVNAWKYIDKNPGSIRSTIDLAADPQFAAVLQDQQATMAVLNYSDHRRRERETGQKQEDRAGLVYKLNQLRDEGTVFPDLLSFMSYANKFGVYQNVESLYNAQRQNLTEDEKLVKEKHTAIMKSAYAAFMHEEGTGLSIPGITDPKLKGVLNVPTTTKLHVKPPELRTIENALFSIYNDNYLKPYEKSEKMTEFIKNEAVKLGVPKDKIDQIDPLPILANQFLVKNYHAKLTSGGQVLQDRLGLTSGLVGEPVMLPGGDGTTLPSTQIIEPPPKAEVDYHVNVFKNAGTPEVVDAFYSSAEKKGYKNVRFVSNEDAGMYGAPGTKYTGYVGVNKNGQVVRLQPKNR